MYVKQKIEAFPKTICQRDYIAMIHAFETTKTIVDVAERNAQRDMLINQMYETVINISGVEVDNIVTDFEHWGQVAYFLVNLLAKLRGAQCFEGPLLTNKRLKQVLKITSHSSWYLRNTARRLVSFFIESQVFSQEENEYVVDHLKRYTLDGRTGQEWVWDGLATLCPISENAFIGSMAGQCVGDALGFIVEGQEHAVCQRYVKEFVFSQQVPSWVRIKGMTFGQYSDDSQLARETYVTAIQADSKMDPAVFGNRIGCLFQPGHYRIVGYGATTAKAGEALFMGKHHSKTGSKTTSGNGSAMRSVPIGLIMSKRPVEELKHVARVFSSVTHASDACMDGSIAMAIAARIVMATRDIAFDRAKFLGGVATHVTNDDYKKEIHAILSFLNNNTPEDQVKTHIIAYGKRMGEDIWGDGVSPGVRQSTLWALYSFCKHPDNYINCIATAISCGGDVDTTAAMAGALCGCRVGFDNVPKIWRDTIHDMDDWKLQDVCTLVREVFDMVKDEHIKAP